MKKLKWIFMAILINIYLSCPTWGLDNLYLCGEIKGAWHHLIIFEVTSESCPGEHYLRVPNPRIFNELASHKGEKRCFMVRENTCRLEFTLLLP